MYLFDASSLLAALDLGDDRTARADLEFIRSELMSVAGNVLAQYQLVTTRRNAARKLLLDAAGRDGLRVTTIAGKLKKRPSRRPRV